MPLPTSQTQSLAEALPAEIARCRELVQHIRGVTGRNKTLPAEMLNIKSLLIEASLKRADAALASGDHLAMLRSYQELKDHE